VLDGSIGSGGREVMKKALVVLAFVVLAVPAAYAATPGGKNTPQTTTATPQGAGESAAHACKAERAAMGSDAFAKKYGTNHNLRNAFGKCVSGKSEAKDEIGKDETEKDEKDDHQKSEKAAKDDSAAAKQCKKERAGLGVEAFGKKYGTNANRANAFGKCVSGSSKKKDETD
jgi:hypothetical protein